MVDENTYIHDLAAFLNAPILGLDSQRKVVFANSAAEALFAVTQEGLIGQEMQSLVAKEVSIVQQKHFVSLFKDGQQGYCGHVDLLLHKNDGDPLAANTKVFALKESSDSELSYLLLFNVASQSEINFETDALRNEFLGMAVHEFRTPVHRISLAIEILLSKDLSAEKQEEFLQMIFRASRTMNDLINDLLDLTKIRSGKINLHCESVDVQAYIEELLELHKMIAEEKKIKLVSKIEENLPAISLDKRRIMQVFNNFLSNAFKFSDCGTSVHVEVKTKAKHLEISVLDEGPGIEEKDHDKIFQAFHRLKNKPTAGEHSTGLGLAISRKIVELHNGKIWVESTPGQGSRFCFSIPY